MDDCLSGLDMETERHCFLQILSKDGLLKKTGATVVLVTHAGMSVSILSSSQF
jgi:ATP-binding cassette subfamily C (CFTR/MRP) protein 1